MTDWLAPALEQVHHIHDRFQRELIEALHICPFAKRSREQGKVTRPVYFVDRPLIDPKDIANDLATLGRKQPQLEIVLFTFVSPDEHPWSRSSAFEVFCRAVRDCYENLSQVRPFYMVAFHPDLPVLNAESLTPNTLVNLLRRSPDPVIQCIDAQVLDNLRRQTQAKAEAKMRSTLSNLAPEMAHMLATSVMTDSELSSDIAQQNFQNLAAGMGRIQFDRIWEDIMNERESLYRSTTPR